MYIITKRCIMSIVQSIAMSAINKYILPGHAGGDGPCIHVRTSIAVCYVDRLVRWRRSNRFDMFPPFSTLGLMGKPSFEKKVQMFWVLLYPAVLSNINFDKGFYSEPGEIFWNVAFWEDFLFLTFNIRLC